MDIAIYVADDRATSMVRDVVETVGELPEGYEIRVVDVAATASQGLPAELLRVLSSQPNALPLVMVDGRPALGGRLPTAYEIASLLPDDGKRPAAITRADSGVQFSTSQRLHVSLNVSSIDVSLPFYQVLFGAEPTKVRPQYAKFELEDMPINFTLNERSFEQANKEGPVGHFGIQVKSSDAVMVAKERYLAAGFHVEEEMQTACCYAVQSKIWVADPDLNKWEVYVVTEAEADAGCGPDCICLPCYMQMKASTVRTEAAAGVPAAGG